MKLITVLENLKNNNVMHLYDKVYTLYHLGDKYNLYESLEQIVKADVIDDIIRDYISTGSSWERIYFFLSGVKVLNQEYYRLDGYGNLENLTSEKFYITLDDFIQEIKDNGLENEEI